jgi:hypothetical protein
MRHYVPMRTGDEFDALTRWRKVLPWRAGARAKIKRLYRRRERRVLNRGIRACA